MVAPNPQLRIPPSGPLAGPNTNPLAEFAGALYKSSFIDNEGAEHIARIGPTDGGTFYQPAHVDVCYLARGGSAPQPSVGNKIITPMIGAQPSPIPSDDFEFGVGIWLVEAIITCGFNTNVPATFDAAGGLAATFSILNADGSVATAFPSAGGLMSLAGGNALTQTSFRLIHSGKFQAAIPITNDMLAANANLPFKGLSCMLERTVTTEAIASIYSTSSGYLEFTSDCSLSIKRFR